MLFKIIILKSLFYLVPISCSTSIFGDLSSVPKATVTETEAKNIERIDKLLNTFVSNLKNLEHVIFENMNQLENYKEIPVKEEDDELLEAEFTDIINKICSLFKITKDPSILEKQKRIRKLLLDQLKSEECSFSYNEEFLKIEELLMSCGSSDFIESIDAFCKTFVTEDDDIRYKTLKSLKNFLDHKIKIECSMAMICSIFKNLDLFMKKNIKESKLRGNNKSSFISFILKEKNNINNWHDDIIYYHKTLLNQLTFIIIPFVDSLLCSFNLLSDSDKSLFLLLMNDRFYRATK